MSHILLIDDDPNERLLTLRELEREFTQLKVTEVTSENDWKAVNGDDFDLVITDYHLCWTTGLKILQSVKSSAPECPVIMFTNTGSEEIAVEAMKAGLDDYIIKSPQHYHRLAMAVRSAMARVVAQRQVSFLEQRLQSLLNKLNVGVFRCDTQGHLLEKNKAFMNLLNIEVEKAESLVQQIFQNTTLTDAQEIQVISEEQQRWLLVTQTHNQINGETVIEGIIEDITARKQAEAALLGSIPVFIF